MRKKKNSSRRRCTITSSEMETLELGRKLAGELQGDEIILLTGPLGAGKTIMAKGLAAGLETEDVNRVCSPSYTLMNIYRGRHIIFHIDLFRLSDPGEIEELGWQDFIGEGVIIIEWAERLPSPVQGIHVRIEILDSHRRRITVG